MTSHPQSPLPLPTGTVTFLFTDIEGSTTLWERHPDAMRVALARHDALLRDAIESSGGYVVKTTGDGVCAAFARTADALVACVAAQRALQAPASDAVHASPPANENALPAPLRVRMGLHTGAAELRDGDYFGTTLNRAARIMALAHGDQVLLSAASAELVRNTLPAGVTLRELGEVKLKGLARPERVLQVVAEDLRSSFPSLVAINANNLPAERDAFVGRQAPLAELERRLAGGARLVSILGIGGTGKTRLVTRFGREALARYPGGVWFCDLAQARSVDGIVHAVAQGLDVPLGKEDPVAQLGNVVAARGPCLVILDNFEQVARHAEATLGQWLDRASDARFLVTTREVLGLPGEEVLALPPLAPTEAAALFLRRAEAVKPGFEPGVEDASAIAPLMNLLEGLPLAIELAAARLRVMSPRTLLARMNERFKLLSTTGGRPSRQATLRAVFDWSWDLLTDAERAALAQLSVFEGGFTLESSEAVLDLSAFADAPWTLDAVQSLVQKSLVRQVADNRFDMLVSVQEYAAEHLRTAGRYPGSGPGARLAAETRHGAHFAALDENAAVADGFIDLDNLVAACRRAVARGDAATAARALEGAWAGLKSRGPFRAGVELAAPVQRMAGLGGSEAARVGRVAADALRNAGMAAEARATYEKALAQARDSRNRECECGALLGLAMVDMQAGRYDEAREGFTAARGAALELGNPALEGEALSNLGILEYMHGRLGSARSLFDLALALARRSGDREREGNALANIGVLRSDEGDLDDSRSHYQAALNAAREIGSRRLEGNALCNLGFLCLSQERFEQACAYLEEALVLTRDLGNGEVECVVLTNLGLAEEGRSRSEHARAHYGAALRLARERENRRREGQVLTYLGVWHARRHELAAARECLDAAETNLRVVADSLGLGILHASRAEVEWRGGSPDAARAAYREAEAIAADSGAGPKSELGCAMARAAKLLG